MTTRRSLHYADVVGGDQSNAIEIFSSRPTFGDVASGASHDIGARNAIEFFEVHQRLEMLRVALVTILARKMRLKFFEVD